MAGNERKKQLEDRFWSFTEENFMMYTPKFMRLALSCKDQANPVGLSRLTEKILNNEENGILHLIRYEMVKHIRESEYVEYFGIYANQPEKFIFEDGHVDTILGSILGLKPFFQTIPTSDKPNQKLIPQKLKPEPK